jgi:hypothetical protein
MIRESQFGAGAQDLAARGYFVFPLRPCRKTPLTSQGFKDATRDEAQILRWWDTNPDANIGVACGASGINVLDIDAKAGADPMEVVTRLAIERHAAVWTGEAPERSAQYPDSLSGERGAQIFFRGDRRTAPRTAIRGVELRGAGAYVAVPPSVHPSGVPYLGKLPPAAKLAEIPASVLEILRPEIQNGQRTPSSEWLAILQGVDAGERNNQLARLAGHLLRRYVDVDVAATIVHLVNEHRCRPPLPAAEVDRTFESICAAEQRRRAAA